MSIVLYDLASSTPGQAWSPNTWKTRFCLNFKGIPYTTQWVEYPDIEPLCKKLGIKPTATRANGNDYYSLPAIFDPSTGEYVSESSRIAEYLENTYPDTPSVMPFGTAGLQTSFRVALGPCLGPLWGFILPVQANILNQRSREHFERGAAEFGLNALEDMVPIGDQAVKKWAAFKEGMEKVDSWYAKSEGGPFIMGNVVCWADFLVGGWLIWMRTIWGEHSDKWEEVASWNGGRWQQILHNLDQYTTVI